MHDENLRLGDAIRGARRRAGLSQVKLAVRAGVSLSTIRLAETAGVATSRTLVGIARALGMRIDDLRGRHELPKVGIASTC